VIALVIGLVIGAPIALAPHAAKTTLRGVSTATTVGLASPIVSVVEDTLALVLSVLAFLVPILTALLVATCAWLVWRRLRRAGSPGRAN
jgi:apolipoprotein N-acyltransferase